MKQTVQIRLFLCCLAIAIFLGSCAATGHLSELRQRKLHQFKMVNIGGVEQAILINSKKAGNPVLVYLHGGPGYPMLPFEPFDNYMRQLEENFTVVYWEQRGTGRSYDPEMAAETMNIEQFVSDTREVVEYIREVMHVDKVFLWGHSWGSNLGAIYASRYPETLHAYISTGQSANPFLNERLAYEYVKEKATADNNRRALKQLAKIDTIPDRYTVGDALTIRKWVFKYGGIVFNNDNERPYVDFTEMKTILTSPFYSLMVRLNLLIDPYFSINTLWEDLKHLNLFAEAPKIDVPVYFLVGRHDKIVSHVLAERYFHHIKAPQGKNLIWFESSAHRPHSEEQDKFLTVMLQIQNQHWQSNVSRIP